MDAMTSAKPTLARGELRHQATTTLDEYQNTLKDKALERRFRK
jgi:ATP-dependent Clp protease ATP-binding subunit ClpA